VDYAEKSLQKKLFWRRLQSPNKIKEDFLRIVRVVDRDMRRKRNLSGSGRLT
jgi:hypothetical protein